MNNDPIYLKVSSPYYMGFGKYFLIALSVLLVSFTIPSAFAVSVSAPAGSSVPGCEETNECFIPADVTINVGDSLTWYNADTDAHTVTSGSAADGPDGNFDSSLFMAGTTFEVTFDEAGSYPYFCLVHPWMVGTVTVEDSSISQPVPTPVPTPTPTPSPAPFGTDVVATVGSSVPGCEDSRNCYDPYRITVGRGSTVTWYNADTAAHTVTSGTPNRGPDGEFDSSLFMGGTSFSVTFDDYGTYPYFCMVHPWMEGQVIVQRGGTISPVPTPAPTPTPFASLSISTDRSSYSPGTVVTINANTDANANVAVSVTDSDRTNIVSRTISTDRNGQGEIEFKLSDSARSGTYNVDASASINGRTVSDSSSFTVKSSSARVSILSLSPTDQQGNPVSSFSKGKLGFVKVVIDAEASVGSLVTINLFDSDLTSLGIGSFKTTLSPGTSEMTLSFFIPNDAESGTADIYANAFTDWPSQGGTPLTGEKQASVTIR